MRNVIRKCFIIFKLIYSFIGMVAVLAGYAFIMEDGLKRLFK